MNFACVSSPFETVFLVFELDLLLLLSTGTGASSEAVLVSFLVAFFSFFDTTVIHPGESFSVEAAFFLLGEGEGALFPFDELALRGAAGDFDLGAFEALLEVDSPVLALPRV